MKHNKLSDALNEIQDDHILEAVSYKKRRLPHWVYPVAAVLAVAVLVGVLWKPISSALTTPQISGNPQEGNRIPDVQGLKPPDGQPNPYCHLSFLKARAEYPKMTKNPNIPQGGNYEVWWEDQLAMHTQPEGYGDSLETFWGELMQELMADTNGSNVTFSPVNIYMALAMLAETADGQSRQQILDVLGADNIEALRTQAKQVWQGHYNDDGLSTSILANSLWLEENYGFNQETADLLAENYYASVFQGDLGSKEMNQALQAWLNEQTGGLLKDQIHQAKLDPTTVLALASTIYYQVQWVNGFNEEKNTEAVFHGANGASTETYMNQTLSYGPYYWSDNFGAVALHLEDGSTMWLFLPDEGVTPESIVEEVRSFLSQNPQSFLSDYENQKSLIVHLSLPKFDISGDLELSDALQNMGITDIFDEYAADFTPILPQDDGGFISNVRHATRVAINEDGVTAAAFTLILRCGAGLPPEDEVDFVLDRPFLFYVESADGLPLFTGIVNEP